MGVIVARRNMIAIKSLDNFFLLSFTGPLNDSSFYTIFVERYGSA
jgi:hypothetical protein